MVHVKTYGATGGAPVPSILLPKTPTIPIPSDPATPPPQVAKPSTVPLVPTVEFDRLGRKGVFQCVQYEPKRSEYYVSQAGMGTNGSATPYQTTTVSRTTNTGHFLDSMTLNDAGHGSLIGVENTNGRVYIWATYNKPLDSTDSPYDLVRIPYAPGVFDRAQIPGLKAIPRTSTGYSIYSFDWENNWVCERTRSGTTETYKRRKISDLVAGFDRVYNTVVKTVPVLQGVATVNNYLFIYSGAPNGEQLTPADPAKLSVYYWPDGSLYDTVDLSDLGSDVNGDFFGGTHEPESVTMYRDPATGKANVQVGVTLGVFGSHRWLVWTYYDIGAAHTELPFIVTDDTFGTLTSTDSRLVVTSTGIVSISNSLVSVNSTTGIITV